MKIEWEQKTEEEAKEIAWRNGFVYNPKYLYTYKYVSRKSIEELRRETPYMPRMK
jgi:hypothetical protein